MRKFVVGVAVVIGLSVAPGVASAAPILGDVIGTNTNLCDPDFGECDIYADFGDGLSELPYPDSGYLAGFTLLLNTGAAFDLGNGFDASDVAHILVIRDTGLQLFSNLAANIAASTAFINVFTQALAGGNVAQITGCPAIPSGVPTIAGVGYCNTADTVTLQSQVAWDIPGFGNGNDTVRIHAALPDTSAPPVTPVPEPGTLTLLGFGGSAAAAAIRRRRAAATTARANG